MLVWSALTALAAFASNYTMLVFSRLGFAVGEAVVAPAATSWIGDLFPAAGRSRPLSIFMLGVPVGGAADRTALALGTAFMTGAADPIRTLAKSVGFGYSYDEDTKQYAHAAVIFGTHS